MPNNTDLSRGYVVDQDRIDTRKDHGEKAFDKAIGKKPEPPSGRKPGTPATEPAPTGTDTTPPFGKGGLAK